MMDVYPRRNRFEDEDDDWEEDPRPKYEPIAPELRKPVEELPLGGVLMTILIIAVIALLMWCLD